MNRRAEAKAKAKSKALAGPVSGSGQGKIPAKPTKLRGEIRTPPSSLDKKNNSFEGSPVVENVAELQLCKGNTTTPKPKPEEKKTSSTVRSATPFKFTRPCELCNVFGHWNDFCPYLERLPDYVTEVPKGYKISCSRGVRYAVWLHCALCQKNRDHETVDCPNKSKYRAQGHPLL